MFNTKAGLFVDLFLVLLVLLLPAMMVAVALVRKGRVKAHGTIMSTAYVLFLLGVVAFEIQVHFGTPGPPLSTLPLVIHLCFAVPALVVWTWQVATAKKALTQPATHRKRGKALMAILVATVGTGIWLYVETFA